MFSEVANIALVATRLGQFQQLLKTRVILILNFTRPHAITYTNPASRVLNIHQPKLNQQVGQTGGKQIITLLTNDVQQRSIFRGEK